MDFLQKSFISFGELLLLLLLLLLFLEIGSIFLDFRWIKYPAFGLLLHLDQGILGGGLNASSLSLGG